ncbi:MAG: RNA-binding cell elongation regulator Jag/EloR [Clostridia bacterium]
MPRTIIVEGKTTNEALEKGLKELNVSKNMVEYKQIEDANKRSFYSILAPRVVKLEITVKDENIQEVHKEKRKKIMEEDELKKAEEKIQNFLKSFLPEDIKFETKIENTEILVNLDGEEISYLIGYRGETINALQNILSVITNNEQNLKAKVFLDVSGYKEKRIKTLENLAEKMAKTVIRTRKPITLEPMTAYERKIIHTALQNNDKIKTFSKGEEPHRRLVISLK